MKPHSALLPVFLALSLPIRAAPSENPFPVRVTPAPAEGADAAAVSVAVPPKHVVYADSFKVESGGRPAIPVRADTPAHKPDPLNAGETVAVFARDFVSVWRIPGLAEDKTVEISLQGCDDTTCFPPETRAFALKGGSFVPVEDDAPPDEADNPADWAGGRKTVTAGGYLSPSAFLAFLDRAEGAATGKTSFFDDPVAFLRRNGIWLTLFLILLGGLLLNVTPCVLPMIPVNLAIIGAGAASRATGGRPAKGRGFALGAAYGLGIVLAYGGAGWAVVRSGAFFGSAQGSPWFSLGASLLFAAFALAMFDLFAIDFSRFRKRRASKKGAGTASRLAGAFAAGALSAVMAGACVAPVVLAVLLLAGSLYADGSFSAQFLPFVLGLGMAIPWPFAGMGLSVLPKPGMWMTRVKQAFGAFLLLLAGYYAMLAYSGFTYKPASSDSGGIAAGDRAAWDAALKAADGRPVLVDFWATWCKNCVLMERRTLRDPAVRKRLSGYAVIRVQTERPGEADAMLNAFGVKGLPAFAVLLPANPSASTD